MKDESVREPQSNNQTAAERKSGRAAFDGDGRSIWEWQVITGVFTRTVTDDQLTTLAATTLRVVETPPAQDKGTVWLYGYDGSRAQQCVATADSGERGRRGKGISKSRQTEGPVRRFLRRLTGTA